MKILVIDNYDSFTYNLVQLLGALKCQVVIKQNDELKISDISKINPDKILISPGPGKPEDSKISLLAIKEFVQKIPILGVCLGHQAIAIAFGGRVITAPRLLHGKTSLIRHDNKSIFKNLKQNFKAARYHSLVVEQKSLPGCLSITAISDDEIIMGLRHNKLNIEGIQFHPESVLTETGKKLLKNWIDN
jgi:anthranilate synthase/aminodeoxychorismate synthase-like glutamine amidotransferase